MNYLAHLYLSGSNEDVLLGNYIADGIKGEDKTAYKKGVLQGINLHKKIDIFTDSHPVFKQSTKRLSNKYRHYSWVIVDIYYDHFLANLWTEYHPESLNNYASAIYKLLSARENELPKYAKQFLGYMKQYNILYNYSKLEGIERVLEGLAKRARFQSNMEKSIVDLREMYQYFEADFRAFFPELIIFVQQQEEYTP